MRKLLNVSLVLLLGLIACKSTKSQQSKLVEQKGLLKIEISKNHALGETVNIQVLNTSSENLVLYGPTKPKIQKNEQNKWRTIRILDCPCDAPCNAPPEKIDFPINKKISLRWDQKESYCGKRDEAGIRETISVDAGAGEYRLVTSYKHGTEKKVVYNEFTIN